MGKVKVKKVFSRERGSCGPYQVLFQHAELSTEVAGRDLSSYFQAQVFKNVKKSFLDSSEKTGSKSTILLRNNQMTYLGSPEGSLTETSTGNYMKTYIGIKRKNKITFHEVTPVVLTPFVKSHSFVEEREVDTSVKQTAEERKQAEISLIKAFGSKKKRLYLESKEKNVVVDMNASIEAAALDAKVTEIPLELKDTSYLSLIPPCNRNAKVASEVYNLSDLLTDYELELLEPQAKRCLMCLEADVQKWQKSEVFSDYFFASLKWLQVRKEEPRNLLSMKIVLYTEILIRFYKMKYSQIRRKIPDFPNEFPVQLVRKVFDNFTTVNALNVRSRSDELKDKACCYIMVLVLLAGDYIFDVQLMSTIFQIHIKKLLLLARAVGITATYISASREYKALLKIPLPPPVEKRGRTKRRI